MFDMSLPWWEFILRGVMVYCVLLVLVRVSGKRTVGQLYLDILKRSRIAESDVHQALREGDVELPCARCIYLEADGSITVLKKKS